MNAYAIASGGATSAGATGGAAGTATGKTGGASAGGFLGALVQAMGVQTGTGAQGAGGSAMPAGLAGLMGLPGGQTSENGSSGLMDLISGLTEQLGAMDPNAALPADLQDQLAALLLLVQGLLAAPRTNAQANGITGEVQPAITEAATPEASSSNGAGQPLVSALRQALVQLGNRLSQDETLYPQASGLTAAFRQTFEAVQPLAGKHPATPESAKRAGSEGKQPVSVFADPRHDAPTLSADSASAKAEVKTEVRATSVPFRHPLWAALTASNDTDTAQAAEGRNQATSAQPAEASGQNGSAPVWTLLKGDQAANPAPAAPQAPAAPSVPVQQFADHMGKFLVKQFVLTHGNGSAEAKISLHPEHLGQVDIKILIQNGQLTAQFVTESGAARDLLDNQMAQLRSALQAQGLQVDKMEVVQQSSQPDAASFFQQHPGHSGSGQQGGGAKGRNAKGSYEDSAAFEAELDRTAFLREIGYGSSLNVTA